MHRWSRFALVGLLALGLAPRRAAAQDDGLLPDAKPDRATGAYPSLVVTVVPRILELGAGGAVPYPEAGGYVAAQFIVDTAGRLEPGSLTWLVPGDSAVTAYTRAVLEGARFRPAEVDGRRVRAITTETITWHPRTPGTEQVETLSVRPGQTPAQAADEARVLRPRLSPVLGDQDLPTRSLTAFIDNRRDGEQTVSLINRGARPILVASWVTYGCVNVRGRDCGERHPGPLVAPGDTVRVAVVHRANPSFPWKYRYLFRAVFGATPAAFTASTTSTDPHP